MKRGKKKKQQTKIFLVTLNERNYIIYYVMILVYLDFLCFGEI